ncbi:hypothetical protein [Photobacterium gaetbulicola]|uniref:hypothetical protein n=1 Tax=Photobacterium gaetbulicola TaxID=1295392 RepID=UPI0018CF8446|nr:hypothetical protein [Photobacterium gaetbulicola]
MMKMNKIALSILAVCVGYSVGSLASGKYDDYDDDDEYSSSYESEGNSSSGSYSHSYYSNDGGSYSGGGGYSDDDSSDGYGDDDGTKQRLALNLVGTGEMYPMTVPPLEKYGPPLDANCFDVELKNIHDGQLVGWATDCLSEIQGAPETGIQLIGTTFFYLPDGLLITRGNTTVQPVLQPTTTPGGQYISHITGASSDENAVVKGYGEYRWHKGTVRLSGMVDLTNYDGTEGSPMFFDCLFIIELEEYQPEFKSWYDWYRYRYYQESFYEEYHSDMYYGEDDDSYYGSGGDRDRGHKNKGYNRDKSYNKEQDYSHKGSGY